ncbi:MAG: long-chain fatty acid--CoA ligase [Planctomycetaceae bacterium]|nr:long-chain fatty acid--CoA ligase [Planctomycetaceae bacterium]
MLEPDGAVTYDELLSRTDRVSAALLPEQSDLQEARVAYLLPPGADYVAAQWGIWQAGGVATPLSLSAAPREWQYVLADSQASALITTADLRERVAATCNALGVPIVTLEETAPHSPAALPSIMPDRRAMILYTSGTTSQPKGVVSTHGNIQAQIETLIDAWKWQADDAIPLFLPLHHVHGIINIMSCALWAGARVEPFPKFDAAGVLQRVAAGAYSVFMAVPTIYVKLIDAVETLPESQRAAVCEGFRGMRLMVSGSAALPATIHVAWSELTGQQLLERYGMTEIGMALSNPYDGERRPGAVGQPLPGVELRLVDEQGRTIDGENQPGEIQVRGPGVFAEYWNRPEATAEAFVDGWFRTGDIAVRERGAYRILGRSSVDIIKSGGYKLSALEIETALLEHPAIAQCAVVGLPDDTWGETVAAAVVLRDSAALDAETLTAWCREQMSSYKVPQRLLFVDSLPRNAMGKVTKPAVRELF